MDRIQPEVTKALRAVGASVQPVHMVGGGFPADLLVGYSGLDFKLSLKDPDRVYAKEPEKRQAKWESEWQGQPTITVRSVSEALAAIGAA